MNAESDQPQLKIFIFTEGTILKPGSPLTLYRHKSYVPIGRCREKIATWSGQGAEIVYCTAQKGKRTADIADILRRYCFAGTELCSRGRGERYKDIVERIKPDVLIEDDCRSIGGKWQMCITYVDAEIRQTIKSVVVKEFGGIDDLPDDIAELRASS